MNQLNRVIDIIRLNESIDYQIQVLKNNPFHIESIDEANQSDLLILLVIFVAYNRYHPSAIHYVLHSLLKNKVINFEIDKILDSEPSQFSDIFDLLNDDLKTLIIFNIDLFK